MEQKNHGLRFMAISGWALALILICASIANGTWQSATANPPGDNLSARINVGSSTQTKSGALTLNNALTVSGASLFQSTATFTPTANNANQFKITNAAGNDLFKIDTTNNITSISGGGTGIGLTDSGAAIGALTVGSNDMIFGSVSGYKLGIGLLSNELTDNLTVSGTSKATSYVKSDTGFCIGASCITTWPTSGESGSPVPSTGMVLSSINSNPQILTAGYTQFEQMPGMPYTVPYYLNGGVSKISNLYIYTKQ